MTMRSVNTTSPASILGFLVLSAAVTAALFIAQPSRACWDGAYVETARVTMTESQLGDRWTPALARNVGRWTARIEALLPENVHLTVQHGVIEICGADGDEDFGCVEPDAEWTDGELSSLFEAVAQAIDVDPNQRQLAQRLKVRTRTVQLGSFSSRKGAQLLAMKASAALDDADIDLFGFLEVGSFPADNAHIHVVEDGQRFRVVVGAYLDPAEARLAARQIAAVSKLRPSVRPL